MNASLNEKLGTVKWGEFKYKEVFNRIEQGRRLKKDDQIDGTIPFVMSGTTNAGVVNYISNPVASFPKNAITIDIFGNTFYRNYAFGAGDDTGVYWNDATAYSSNAMLFFAVAMQKSMMGRFSYGKKLRSSQSEDFTMHLPVTDDGAIDFDFMESFIAELEAERVAELSAYLTVSGLDNYELSSEEESVLKNFQSLKWDTYNLEKLFGKATRGKRLKGDDRIAGTLPFVTAGEASEGISAYISNEVEVFEKNTTTIDMFGSAKYRNYKYGADDHVAVVHTEAVPMKAAIFVTSACHKAAHTGKFDYGHNFYAKDADALDIQLPTKDGKPDYDTMTALISAVQKLVIKDVVLYADRKIEKAKTITKH
ncbi:MAG: restriction endonuclease subunit S [Hominenteromicrobium sp.]|uniref:restriction endonuclease subunit S n=1 Tax=Hominenteromicrobium sp. TaxID=3073581 RepID=UPI003991B76B